ncbi:unnamed protein product, partial [Eruca vesicaria subsp. sativa]|nr:unnamed protein product [Eruca vesicaria subsp. sativa]
MKEKRKRDAIKVEGLPRDLVEEILQRLEIKSLVRFTSVSKQWNAMIKSRSFASRHLVRTQSRDPDILLGGALHHESNPYPCLRILESHFSFTKVNYVRKPSRRSHAVTGSCDGLVCIYDFSKVIYVFNPATRWCRFLPRAKIQQINRIRESQNSKVRRSYLGFGKDIVTSKYKMVWLYNSKGLDLDGETTCEVFDFTTNTWRHVNGSSYQIYEQLKSQPLYLNGSLHWFTVVESHGKIKMICFDLHTEVFQLMSEIPIATTWAHRIILWSLNNGLCVSEMKNDGIQDIWSLNSHKAILIVILAAPVFQYYRSQFSTKH